MYLERASLALRAITYCTWQQAACHACTATELRALSKGLPAARAALKSSVRSVATARERSLSMACTTARDTTSGRVEGRSGGPRPTATRVERVGGAVAGGGGERTMTQATRRSVVPAAAKSWSAGSGPIGASPRYCTDGGTVLPSRIWLIVLMR